MADKFDSYGTTPAVDKFDSYGSTPAATTTQPGALERGWKAHNEGIPQLNAPDWPELGPQFRQQVSDAAHGIAALPGQTWDALSNAGQAMLHGDLKGLAWHAAGAAPYLGPLTQQFTTDIAAGNYPEAVGHGANILESVLVPKLLEDRPVTAKPNSGPGKYPAPKPISPKSSAITLKERLTRPETVSAATDLIPYVGPSTGYKAKVIKLGKAIRNPAAPERFGGVAPEVLDPLTNPRGFTPGLPSPPGALPTGELEFVQHGVGSGAPMAGPMEYETPASTSRGVRTPKPPKPKPLTRAEKEVAAKALDPYSNPAPIAVRTLTPPPPDAPITPSSMRPTGGSMEHGGPPITYSNPVPVELPTPVLDQYGNPVPTRVNPPAAPQPRPDTTLPTRTGVGAGPMEYGGKPPGAPYVEPKFPPLPGSMVDPMNNPAPASPHVPGLPVPSPVATGLVDEYGNRITPGVPRATGGSMEWGEGSPRTPKGKVDQPLKITDSMADHEVAKHRADHPPQKPAATGDLTHGEGDTVLPKREDLPLHYAAHRAKVGDVGASRTFAKDLKIATRLKEQGITPEQWQAMDLDTQNSHVVATTTGKFNKTGKRAGKPTKFDAFEVKPSSEVSRPADEGVWHIGETLRMLYQR